MRKIIFATNNQHKLDEIRALLKDKINIVSLKDIGFNEEIPETSNTLKGNSLQKAEYIHQRYKMDVFADDTGLEIDALDGRPGVYSARYAGEHCSFADNNKKVLEELKNTNDRSARFVAVITLIIDNKTYYFEGKLEGEILRQEQGEKGFGYDPVFQAKGYDCSIAEISAEEKNNISHRGNAVRKMIDFLNDYV